MAALAPKQISSHLKTVPRWAKRGRSISRTYKFESFLEAISFVARVAREAEKLAHHPDMDIRYDRVTLRLTTHDEGGITELDFLLAQQGDKIFSAMAGA